MRYWSKNAVDAQMINTPSIEQEEKGNYIAEILSFTIQLNITDRIISSLELKRG
jgi:hypothetical protein